MKDRGVAIERHPSDKDDSDLDLALQRAAGLEAERIELISGGGGRLDHQLVTAQLLARPEVAALPLTAHISGATLAATPARSTHRIEATVGTALTLLAMGGAARVETHGLRWNLTSDTELEPGSTLGLSNIVAEQPAGYTVTEGIVLAIVVSS